MTEASEPGEMFWGALEGNPSLVARRSLLLCQIGTSAVEALSKSGVLRYHGVAHEYPCESPTDEGCPRRIIPERSLAVCGATPARCRDVKLTADDLAQWEVDLDRTRALVKAALSLSGAIDCVHAPYVHRLGSTPQGRQDVFLALVPDSQGWRAVVDRLKAHALGQPFGLLVPTDAVPSSIATELQRDGCACLYLHQALAITRQGAFTATGDLATWMATIGAVGAPATSRESYVDVYSEGRWHRDLDRAAYERWIAREAEFDIFVDEVRRVSSKKMGAERERHEELPIAQLAALRKAIGARARFAPESPEEKEAFVRGRKTVDIRTGGKHSWALFPTHVTERLATYGFRHDGGGRKYAFIFLANSSGRT